MNKTIVFGGGCFWCTEAVFEMLKGIFSVNPGYAGGNVKNPTYQEVSDGATGHAEVVKIEYDPESIPLENLLIVFFASHDPTSLNRQGNDVGEQYRSAIFYEDDNQKEICQKFINDLNNSSEQGKPIVTELKKLDEFYPAEDYHKDYYKNNKNRSYCQVIINPKLKKIQKEFSSLLKKGVTKKL